MLVPKIEKTNEKSTNVDKIIIDSISLKECFYDVDMLFSEKAKKKFIMKIEQTIRSSYEYRNYIGILKNELNLTKCTFLPGIDISTTRVGLEMHHYPFTLYELVATEIEKDLSKGYKFIDPYDIADRVTINHYKNIVGLVPLSCTVHELVHAGKKFVNLSYVYGNYENYINKYAKYFPPESGDKLDQLKDLSKRENEGEDIDGNILDIKFLQIEVSDIEKAKKIKVDVSNIA